MRVQDVLSGRLQLRVNSLNVVLRLLKCWNEMALCQVTNDNDCCESFLGNRLHCLYKSPLRSLVGWFWFGLWLNIQLLGVLGTRAQE